MAAISLVCQPLPGRVRLCHVDAGFETAREARDSGKKAELA
jgi:hypothetical protein